MPQIPAGGLVGRSGGGAIAIAGYARTGIGEFLASSGHVVFFVADHCSFCLSVVRIVRWNCFVEGDPGGRNC